MRQVVEVFSPQEQFLLPSLDCPFLEMVKYPSKPRATPKYRLSSWLVTLTPESQGSQVSLSVANISPLWLARIQRHLHNGQSKLFCSTEHELSTDHCSTEHSLTILGNAQPSTCTLFCYCTLYPGSKTYSLRGHVWLLTLLIHHCSCLT